MKTLLRLVGAAILVAITTSCSTPLIAIYPGNGSYGGGYNQYSGGGYRQNYAQSYGSQPRQYSNTGGYRQGYTQSYNSQSRQYANTGGYRQSSPQYARPGYSNLRLSTSGYWEDGSKGLQQTIFGPSPVGPKYQGGRVSQGLRVNNRGCLVPR